MQDGYYNDPFLTFMVPLAVVMFMAAMLVVLFIGVTEESRKQLSPGVYTVKEVVCGTVPDTDTQVCNILVETTDQFDVDEISTTNHILILDDGEEYAETVTLIEPEPEVAEGEGGKLTVSITVGEGGQEDDADETQQ